MRRNGRNKGPKGKEEALFVFLGFLRGGGGRSRHCHVLGRKRRQQQLLLMFGGAFGLPKVFELWNQMEQNGTHLEITDDLISQQRQGVLIIVLLAAHGRQNVFQTQIPTSRDNACIGFIIILGMLQ